MAELSKELIDSVYQAIEVARNTGKIKKGSNEATKLLERGEAKLVVIAEDVNPKEIVMHLPILAEEKGVTCVQVPSKTELGAAAGIDVGTACVAIINEGEAKNIISEIIEKLRADK